MMKMNLNYYWGVCLVWRICSLDHAAIVAGLADQYLRLFVQAVGGQEGRPHAAGLAAAPAAVAALLVRAVAAGGGGAGGHRVELEEKHYIILKILNLKE